MLKPSSLQWGLINENRSRITPGYIADINYYKTKGEDKDAHPDIVHIFKI